MAVDIQTEIAQLLAGSRAIKTLLESKLLTEGSNVTLDATGLRPGRDQQLAGLSQILNMTKAFTLELAIKALYNEINPNPDNNPGYHHDLLEHFKKLNKGVKDRLSAKWQKTTGRSAASQNISFEEFLEKYRLLFETSRYLYERNEDYSTNTKDFDIAIWVVVDELISRSQDKTLLYNMWNMLSEEQGGRMGTITSPPTE